MHYASLLPCRYSNNYDPSFDYYGSERTGSPISFFFSTLARTKLGVKSKAGFATERLLSRKKLEIVTLLENVPGFVERYQLIMNMFYQEIVYAVSEEERYTLFIKWRFNIDLFGFGISCLFVMANAGDCIYANYFRT